MVLVETDQLLIVDTGVLVAAADRSDPRHGECADLLEQDEGPLVTTAMVIAEAAYLLERDLGVDAELALYASIIEGSLIVEALTVEDWTRIKELVTQFSWLSIGWN